MPATVDKILSGLQAGEGLPVYLVHGDLVLAQPAAERIAGALASALGGHVESHSRPPSFGTLLQDLRTFSLFGGGKVLLASDTAVFADRTVAADLIDDAHQALPLGQDRGLSSRERLAASRLLQALRLFDFDPYKGSPEQALEQLPAWAFEGGQASRRGRNNRARGKKQVEEVRTGLAALLEAARKEEMSGQGEGELADLASILHGGMPPGHALVLAEKTVAADHPLVRQLADEGRVVAVGGVESDRGTWQGLDLLAEELARQTGVEIAPDALNELARRTLRQDDSRRGGGSSGVAADSTSRFAGEYRKLANLAEGARIDRRLVAQAVVDRGEEDVWQLLDALATGKGGEALGRLRRLLASAEDPLAARLSFFALLASFCRQLTAIRGMMRVARVAGGEESYPRFKARHAPALQGELEVGKNPLAGLHPFRLHRAYLAASRMPEPMLARLPADVLDTELQLKGDSGEADAALARLVAQLAGAAAPRKR